MIIGDGIILGAGGESASIFITGLSETDMVTASKDGKTVVGKWEIGKAIVHNSPLIPIMTSNTSPSGVASSSKIGENDAYSAFDGNTSTYAYGGIDAIPWTLQYEFPNIVSISSFSYVVSHPSGDAGQRTAGHNVQISIDGNTWETIWSGTTNKGMSSPESDTITLTNTKELKYVKWVTTSMTGEYNPSECLWDFQVYGDTEIETYGFKLPIKSYGTWTITATDGTKTATQDVMVNSATQYHIEWKYRLWLYKDGVSYNFENFHIFGVPTAYGHNFSVAGKITTQKIDLSKYSKICWESSITSSRGAVYFLTDINIDNAFNSQTYMGTSNQTSGEATLEDINNTVYVAVGNHAGWSGDDMSVSDYDTYYAAINSSSSSNNSYYSKVWLE